jgi:Asp-tRNA(Asn)/Glu-tRNA(Gln) amidotransferase A subunit family amidase
MKTTLDQSNGDDTESALQEAVGAAVQESPYSFSNPPLAGLQLVAAHFQERRLLQVARSYERALRRREEDARSPAVPKG